jgi:hypothetical protein
MRALAILVGAQCWFSALVLALAWRRALAHGWPTEDVAGDEEWVR